MKRNQFYRRSILSLQICFLFFVLFISTWATVSFARWSPGTTSSVALSLGFPPSPSPTPSQSTGPKSSITFDVKDPSVGSGTKVTITATVRDAEGMPIATTDKKGQVCWIVSSELEDLIAHKEDGNKITVIGLASLSASAKLVGNYAPIIAQGMDDARTAAVLNVRLSKALAPGPIPPGLDAQVDLMWVVVPHACATTNSCAEYRA